MIQHDFIVTILDDVMHDVIPFLSDLLINQNKQICKISFEMSYLPYVILDASQGTLFVKISCHIVYNEKASLLSIEGHEVVVVYPPLSLIFVL